MHASRYRGVDLSRSSQHPTAIPGGITCIVWLLWRHTCIVWLLWHHSTCVIVVASLYLCDYCGVTLVLCDCCGVTLVLCDDCITELLGYCACCLALVFELQLPAVPAMSPPQLQQPWWQYLPSRMVSKCITYLLLHVNMCHIQMHRLILGSTHSNNDVY